MIYVDRLHKSGTNYYCHATADTIQELERMARRLRVSIRAGEGDRVPHLDLNQHKRKLAIEKGAIEI